LVEGTGEVRVYYQYVLPGGNGAKSGIDVLHQQWLWFAVTINICKSLDEAKSAGRLFDKKGWVEVLHGNSDILWTPKDLTLFELVKPFL